MKSENKLCEGLVPVSKAKRLWLTAFDILLFVILMLLIDTFASMPLRVVFEGAVAKGMLSNLPVIMLRETIMMIAVFIAAFIVLRIRKIPLNRIGLSFRRKDFLYGMLFAITLYALGFGLSLLLGAVEITDIKSQSHFLVMTFMFFLLVAVTEEVAMRGFVLGHLLDNGVNKFVALLISSILFSSMHLFNPNFALLPFLNIVLAGILLGASYIYTRNLCFPITLHLFWNWLQGPVLGYEVSGNRFGESLLTLRLPEANILNGGAFGFEGSIICTVLMIIGTGVILKVMSGKS